jgi:ABC-type lipoprotein release transport system permease subunit
MPGGGESRSSKGQRSGAPGVGGFGGFGGFGGNGSRKKNTVTLTSEDMEEILTFVPGLNAGTMSYTTNATVDGGELEESTSYTVVGVISEMGTVASGISPDTAIFVPYETGIKYLTGNDISPTITVIADDTGAVDTIKANIETVLSENYTNANFAISDAGSKMEAANQSNRTLTLLLYAMAAIVFVVGGIGIMNVLFVSVKERTNEIGILKAIGCSHRDILLEFLLEASTISFIGSAIGVICAVGIMRWGTLLL